MVSKVSRTAQSVKNSIFALLFYLLNLLVQFYSRKIFIDYLGVEIVGLNATATNILQFLNLAELGISSAISYTLYKSFVFNDRNTIKEIVAVQGYLYRWIGIIVCCCALILSLFFPFIFKKIELPLWYTFASFGVLLFSSLLSYFVNYKQIALTANQQNYKIICSFKNVMLVKVVIQIFSVKFCENGYVWWLVEEFVFAIIASLSLRWIVHKEFPYLKDKVSSKKQLVKKYPLVVSKTKQLFFHKISGFVVNQTSPIIIYAYFSLKDVTVYSNYMLIVMGIYSLMNAFFSGMQAGVGHLVAEGEKEKIIKVFRELFSVRFMLILAICTTLWKVINPFIFLWLGADFLLSKIVVLLIIVNLYLAVDRAVTESYIYAYGMFQDIYSPIIETILNIGGSLLFGYLWGIEGILLGVTLSMFFIYFCWKPYFLFRFGLHENISWYIQLYVKHILIGGFAIVISNNLSGYFIPVSNVEWRLFLQNIFILFFLNLLSIGLFLFMFEKGFRGFVYRFIPSLK